jgi:methanogenic corrinoid protein MtbC1
MVADLLRSAGWDVMDFGTDLPLESLVDAASRAERLVVVGLSVTTRGRDADVADAVATIHEALPGVPVMVGGSAIDGADHAASLGADLFAAGPYDAIGKLEALSA